MLASTITDPEPDEILIVPEPPFAINVNDIIATGLVPVAVVLGIAQPIFTRPPPPEACPQIVKGDPAAEPVTTELY